MKAATTFNDLLHQYLTDAEITANRKQAAISAQLEMWRAEHEMTQKQFAAFVGVTQAMVSKWESGEYNFTVKTLAELSDKLGIGIDQLFTGAFEPKTAATYIRVEAAAQPSAQMAVSVGASRFSAPAKSSVTFSQTPGGTVA